jgi:hypothetical protein
MRKKGCEVQLFVNFEGWHDKYNQLIPENILKDKKKIFTRIKIGIYVAMSSDQCLDYFDLKAHRLSESNFLFIFKVDNIRCYILIKFSEQRARFKISVIMS